MRKLLLLLSIMVLSTVASAQYTYQIVLRNAAAPNSGTSANIIGSGAAFHNLTWNVGGTVSTCSVRVDGSADGITWGTGDVIGATTCTSNGNTLSASHIVNYVRINLVTFTGTAPVFTANVSGYITQPSGGGTVTSVTCGTGLSGGTITSTGTCALANTAVTPASYTLASITVDQQGRITAASNGTASGGALVQVETHTASNSAELDFTSCISSTYHKYQIEAYNLLPATNNVRGQIQFSSDGGSTYDTGSHYQWYALTYDTGVATQGSASDTSTQFPYTATITNTASDGGISVTYKINNPSSGATNRITVEGISSYANAGNTAGGPFKGIWFNSAAANAFRIKMSSGNITSGTATCYGITP